MSVNVRVLNHVDGGTANIVVDFNARILSTSVLEQNTSNTFYFSFVTTNRDTEGDTIPTLFVESPSDLALNGAKRSKTDSDVDYSDFTEMIEDYLYDMVNGHIVDQYGSGVSERAGIQFN